MILHVGRIMALPTIKKMNQLLNDLVQLLYNSTMKYYADDSRNENVEKLRVLDRILIWLIIYRILASIRIDKINIDSRLY